MEIERIDFYEAIKLPADRNSLTKPKREFSDADSKLRGTLMELHDLAASTFQSNLNSSAGTEARNYLSNRGVTSEQIAEFGLGVSASSGQHLVRRLQDKFGAENLETSGLVLKRQDGSGFFDRFRGRLMFPSYNGSG